MHRRLYTKKLLHTETFTRRSLYTQQLLDTEVLTHRSLDAQKHLHKAVFTQRRFFTQTLLHTKACVIEVGGTWGGRQLKWEALGLGNMMGVIEVGSTWVAAEVIEVGGTWTKGSKPSFLRPLPKVSCGIWACHYIQTDGTFFPCNFLGFPLLWAASAKLLKKLQFPCLCLCCFHSLFLLLMQLLVPSSACHSSECSKCWTFSKCLNVYSWCFGQIAPDKVYGVAECHLFVWGIQPCGKSGLFWLSDGTLTSFCMCHLFVTVYSRQQTGVLNTAH